MAAKNTIYIKYADAQSHRLRNASGATLEQNEFAVLGEICAVANEAVLNGADGAFDTEDGKIVQTTDLSAGENTFATQNQNVYWNPADGKFSDTATVGYYEVGQLAAGGIKDAAGMIQFVMRRWANAIESDET